MLNPGFRWGFRTQRRVVLKIKSQCFDWNWIEKDRIGQGFMFTKKSTRLGLSFLRFAYWYWREIVKFAQKEAGKWSDGDHCWEIYQISWKIGSNNHSFAGSTSVIWILLVPIIVPYLFVIGVLSTANNFS